MNAIPRSLKALAGMAVLVAGLLPALAAAQEAVIRKNLPERLPNLPKIDEVAKTAIPGIWEVRIGTDLFYTDDQANHLFTGDLVDTRTRANLSKERIDKLTAQKREALEQLDALKAELDAAKAAAAATPPVIYKDPDNPLSSLTDAAAVEAEIAKAQAVLDWSDDHRDGATVTINGEEKYYDADAIKEVRANARKLLKAAPKQQEYIRVREQTLPEAKAFYPEFFQPGSSAHQFLQATLKQYPSIVQFPNWELIVGDAFAGQQLRMARIEQMQKKRASADPAKKAPAQADTAEKLPKAPKPSASPKVSATSSAALRQKANAVLKAGGDRDALAAFMESIV